MIKVDIKMPSKLDLMRAAMAEVEKKITKTAQGAAALHGGVKVKFERRTDGSIHSVKFEGSEAAIKAAQAAVEK